jgi:hypothetical protein
LVIYGHIDSKVVVCDVYVYFSQKKKIYSILFRQQMKSQ